jgi:cytochrome c oxidase cbb3-type subunit III
VLRFLHLRLRALLTLFVFVGVVFGQAASPSVAQKRSAPVSVQGKQAFASTCGGCHGLDGKGGERAPNIADRPNVQRLTDAQISHIIENGIPGTGMPAFHTLAAAQVKSIVAYLRTLQGAGQTARLPGDPARGKTIFFGKTGCSSCHMIAGEGGFIASDLSEYARTRGIEEIRDVIVDPAKGKSGQVILLTVTTRDGKKIAGRVRNEDNFSLQLQSLDGTFHFLSKSEIQGMESTGNPLMPSDYRSMLSAQELNDLISYLMRVAGTNGSNSVKKHDDWDD